MFQSYFFGILFFLSIEFICFSAIINNNFKVSILFKICLRLKCKCSFNSNEKRVFFLLILVTECNYLFIQFFNYKKIGYFNVLQINKKDDILAETLIRPSMRDLKGICLGFVFVLVFTYATQMLWWRRGGRGVGQAGQGQTVICNLFYKDLN